MVHHHNFQPYSDAEGIRLLKENWQLGPTSSFYTDALDECYTLALLAPIQVMTTKIHQKKDDAVRATSSFSRLGGSAADFNHDSRKGFVVAGSPQRAT